MTVLLWAGPSVGFDREKVTEIRYSTPATVICTGRPLRRPGGVVTHPLIGPEPPDATAQSPQLTCIHNTCMDGK